MNKMYEGAWAFDPNGNLCGPATNDGSGHAPWSVPDTSMDGWPWHVTDDGSIIGTGFSFEKLYRTREDALDDKNTNEAREMHRKAVGK